MTVWLLVSLLATAGLPQNAAQQLAPSAADSIGAGVFGSVDAPGAAGGKDLFAGFS